MFRKAIRSLLAASALLIGTWIHAQGIVVIGHAGVKRLDAPTVVKVYTGRAIEIDGAAVTVVNAPVGSSVRARFLQSCLRQDEEKYTAHWTVRRYIGKGAAPKELARTSEIVGFVSSTPGAIGYLDESEVSPGANILLRCGLPLAQSPIMYLYELLASQFDRLIR